MVIDIKYDSFLRGIFGDGLQFPCRNAVKYNKIRAYCVQNGTHPFVRPELMTDGIIDHLYVRNPNHFYSRPIDIGARLRISDVFVALIYFCGCHYPDLMAVLLVLYG